MEVKNMVVAYEGVELSYQDIVYTLEQLDTHNNRDIIWTNDKRKCTIHKNTNNKGRVVECAHSDFVVLARVGDDSVLADGFFFDPTFKTLSLCQVENCSQIAHKIKSAFNYGYSLKSTRIFKEMANYVDFMGFVYDGNLDCIFVSNSSEDNLYCGLTRRNQEAILSNSTDFLEQFCDTYTELEHHVCMKDNEFYTFDGMKVDYSKLCSMEDGSTSKQFVKKNIGIEDKKIG